MYAMAWKCFVLRSINFGEQFFITFLIHLQRLDHSIPKYINLHQKCFGIANGVEMFRSEELRF